MKKELLYCLVCIHISLCAGQNEPDPSVYRYRAAFPKLTSVQLKPQKNKEQAVTFMQRIGLKNKKIEYTLALRY